MDDQQQRILHDIERDLARADPAFAARMRGPRPFPTLSVLCALTYIVVPLEAVLFGGRVAVVTLALAANAVVVILVRRHRRSGRPPPGDRRGPA
ncbi:DUF3040 domain-containing protein [Actinoplanes sp. RD1]|uniref:DUF3040 domain-containing protein n=1 Tax=Actinoplanes sp. RD1 TaxID=3064538 RepID=UPI0027412758|nr:DUF3040 domain-containing protein [Actinoplanes sp. RD1]